MCHVPGSAGTMQSCRLCFTKTKLVHLQLELGKDQTTNGNKQSSAPCSGNTWSVDKKVYGKKVGIYVQHRIALKWGLCKIWGRILGLFLAGWTASTSQGASQQHQGFVGQEKDQPCGCDGDSPSFSSWTGQAFWGKYEHVWERKGDSRR